MKPRDFLNFFKTKSGRLTVFALLFASGLVIFSALRTRNTPNEMPVSNLETNAVDKPQVVQSVTRPFETYSPPTSKPERPTVLAPTNAIKSTIAVSNPPPRAPEQVPPPPIALFADTAAGMQEPNQLSGTYAPYGRLIACETVITVDSASIQTPIIGLVTEDVYHAGKLVIPAGTEVHGTAQTDRKRERITSESSWTFVWQTGEEMRIKAIALDREFDNNPSQSGWGITDGSAGLRGQIIKSDDLAEIKLFAATFLSGAAGVFTEKHQTLLGPINSPSLNNAPLVGAQDVLKVYAERIADAIERDGFYVRVPSGKQFYLYVLQTLDRADATIGGSGTPFGQQTSTQPKL